jgi:hypothetical protein
MSKSDPLNRFDHRSCDGLKRFANSLQSTRFFTLVVGIAVLFGGERCSSGDSIEMSMAGWSTSDRWR